MNSKYIQMFFILVCFTVSCNQASDSEKVKFDISLLNTCDSLRNKAIHDYNSGIKNYTIMGTVEANDFKIFYNDYMEKNFNITLSANCSPDFPGSCYQTTMNSKIEEEYGVNFIKTTRKKASIEFEKSYFPHKKIKK
jgi:hypothetical protein